MNTIRKQIIIALAVLGLGSAAVHAQTAPPEGSHANAMSQQQRAAKMSEHWNKRQASLHDALQLTGGQEAAWTAYLSAIRPDPKLAPQPGERDAWKTMNAPQRLDKMIAMSEQHTAHMKASAGALNTFYSVLNPTQKKVFDQQFMGEGHHGRHQGGHGGPEGHAAPRG
ncbi:Spy/CpxP family protein refolding chaperone [Massilia sp. PWRC2]|uniref:Spy/CpxP family protein refolding chaperone n=1 Tax=Massilia sp. PWRC2 TaxID=2804626 RepID=UPI003CF00807